MTIFDIIIVTLTVIVLVYAAVTGDKSDLG